MNKKEFWVIGVGASAGGLEALSIFFKNLPEEPNAAFIVAQHLAPHAKSMMVELLSRQTKMKVISATDHLELTPGLICVVPPNFDVTAINGELKLTKAGEQTRPKPSVDAFFHSLAKIYGRRAVGIILSGTGSDGSEGVRAIKESGGVIIVQDSESAKYDGMPKSAFETGLVDAVLPPEEIAVQLFDILESRRIKRGKDVEVYDQGDKEHFDKILKYLKKEVGTDFTQYKTSTIKRRIEKRVSALSFNNLADYFDYLVKNASELVLLSQGMLVSVTSFFRDPDAFDSLKKTIDEIVSKKFHGDEFRVWVAGCATGEEAYTLAFVILESLQHQGKQIPIKIFATDLDHEALVAARAGVYSLEDVKGIPEDLLRKYFEDRDSVVEVRKSIREMIVFARQDLIQNPPFVKIDLVSCRNVLIYFDANLQSRVFDIFHYALKPSGVLFLGKSESAEPTLFDIIDRKEKIYRKINSHSKLSSPTGKYVLHSSAFNSASKKKSSVPNISEVAPLELLKMYHLCAVVVDEEGLIHHIIGDVSEFISFPVGSADFRLGNLLSKSATIEFSVLLRKASKENKAFRSRTYKQESSSKKSYLFNVKPLETGAVQEKPLFIVSFEFKKNVVHVETLPDHGSSEMPSRLVELEQEVSATRESLQTVIEELEISNEELQSLNEEMSSTNEELQASNEELETTNEELQSTNEELMTLNEELNVKSAELRMAYSSLENIQTSIASPLVVLDAEMRIVRFNPNANMIFHLTANDIGTKITKASCQCEIPNFEQSLQEAIASGTVNEVICETSKRVFQMRVHPSRDEDKKIIGAVIVFFDNTEFIHTQDKLKSSDKRIRAIMDSSPTLISLKDNLGKYLMANNSFLSHFQITEEELIGKSDREIFPEDFANDIRDNDLEVLLKRHVSEKEEVLNFNGKEMVFLSNRFPLFGPNERNPYAVGTVSLDITQQVKAQRDLKASESRYRAIIEDQAVFICRHGADGKFTFTNNVFCGYFGGSNENNQSRTFLSVVDKADEKRVKEELGKITVHHPIIQYEHRVQNLSSAPVRWVKWIHRGIFDESSNLVEFQAVGFDVTDIHNQTVELLAKENLYTHVLEHTSDYLSVYRFTNNDFILENFNQSSAKNQGFGHPRLIGKKLTDLIDTSHSNEVLQKFHKSVETKTLQTFEENIEGPTGSMTLSTTIVPIHDPILDVMRVVALSRDISKLKRVEKALREEKKNADAANHAKSDFLASMSHELRTPLNVIMGMSQLLGRGQLKPEHLRLVESIQRSSKVLLALIEDVLDLSKIEAGKINFESKPLNLNQLTQDVIQSFETQANQKNINLTRHFDIENNLHVLGDHVRLKQILINLVGNALKFTEKGSVRLNVELESKIGDLCTLSFEVVDSGVGIPATSFPKIFKRFSQADSGTSRKFGGTGLGLAISKQLVELMQGTIGFDSEEGKGSTFWFKIQLPVAAASSSTKLTTNIPDLDFTKFKVLAVDDVPESLRVLKLYFNEFKGHIDLAESGQDALNLIDKNEYDVVLMDMQMPVMDGLETTRRIRALPNMKKKTPIIALTANAMAGDKERCLESGMNDYLTKPVDFDELKRVIKRWL